MHSIKPPPEAEALRFHLVQEAQKHSGAERPDNSQGVRVAFLVERDTAQRAFAGWSYTQIAHWASENHLTVEFLSGGVLHLHYPG